MPRPEELANAEAIADSKKAVFMLAKEELKRAKHLYLKKIQSEQKYQQYMAEYQRSEADLNAALSKMELIKSGVKTETIEAQKMRIKTLEKRLSAMQVRIQNRKLISPIDGTVLTRSFEPNEHIKAAQTLLSVSDLDDCWIKIYVPEPELSNIDIGDEVDVEFDFKNKKILKGKISEISQEASFAPRMNLRKEQRSDIYFPIKISIKNDNHYLKPGMAADVYFSY